MAQITKKQYIKAAKKLVKEKLNLTKDPIETRISEYVIIMIYEEKSDATAYGCTAEDIYLNYAKGSNGKVASVLIEDYIENLENYL